MNDIDDIPDGILHSDGTAIDWDSECLTNWADPSGWHFAGIAALVLLVLAVAGGALAWVM